MRKLISRETIKINELNEIEMLYFLDSNGMALEIYNIYNETVRVIGQFRLDEFYHPTMYKCNSKYFVLYKSNIKKEIVEILTFHDFENQINIIDKYKNLVNRFNCYGGNLAVDKNFENKKYRKLLKNSRKRSSEIMEFNSLGDFHIWLYNCVANSFCNSTSVQEKITDSSKAKIYSMENYKREKQGMSK